MYTYFRLTIIAVVFSNLVACAQTLPLQRDQLSSLTRSSSPSQVENAIGKATSIQQLEFQVSEANYLARTYNLQTGTRSDVMVICSPACIVVPMQVPVYAEYALIQELPSKNLLAWGTLEELSKDEDEKVSSLMPPLKEKLAEKNKK